MRNINLIVIHCSATREGVELTPQALDKMHRQRGFNGTGYHFYIRRTGEVVPCRPLDRMGAHAKGYNAKSIGICYEGGLNKEGKAMDMRTLQQKESLHRLVARMLKEYPQAKVVGHRDLSPDLNGNGIIEPHEWIKMCPCFDVKKEFIG